MASHVVRNTLIITGVVLLLAQVVLVVCWWKLPEWAPEWVIAHSPWPEPALRAVCHLEGGVPLDFHERMIGFGPGVGPALLRQFDTGDLIDRRIMLLLASDLLTEGVRDMRDPPPPGFTKAEVIVLRENLVELARAGLADGTLDLGETASFLAARLQDRQLTPLMCNLLVGQPTPISPEIANVVAGLAALRDPQAVPVLIPLLPIRHKPHPAVLDALTACLAEESLPHVIDATRHPHEVVRVWAASCLEVFPANPALAERVVALTTDRERQVALKAIAMVQRFAPMQAAGTLRQVAGASDDEQVRQAARTALEVIARPAGQAGSPAPTGATP